MESSDRTEDVPPHSPDSNLSPTRTAPQTLPAPHSAPLKTAPVKPPRPKVPIYANIDEVERQTHGAASDSGSSGLNPGQSFSWFTTHYPISLVGLLFYFLYFPCQN